MDTISHDEQFRCYCIQNCQIYYVKDVRSVLEELSMTRKYQKIFAEQEIDLEVFQNREQHLGLFEIYIIQIVRALHRP